MSAVGCVQDKDSMEFSVIVMCSYCNVQYEGSRKSAVVIVRIVRAVGCVQLQCASILKFGESEGCSVLGPVFNETAVQCALHSSVQYEGCSVCSMRVCRLPTSIGNSVRFNWPYITGENQQFIHIVGNLPSQCMSIGTHTLLRV